jgi:hypothetical protein
MAKVFYGAESNFGGTIDMSGGVAMAVGEYQAGGVAGGTSFGPTANLAIQSVQIRAQRPLQTFYDLLSTNVYYVAGRVQANCAMDRILGPQGSMKQLYQQLSDPCRIDKNAVMFTMRGKFCKTGTYAGTPVGAIDVLTGGNKLTLKNCAMQDVAMAMRAQDFLFTEQFSFTATDLLTD